MNAKHYEILISGDLRKNIIVTNTETGDFVEVNIIKSEPAFPTYPVCPVYETKYKVDSESIWIVVNPFSGISFVVAGKIRPGLVNGKYAFYADMNESDETITVYNFTFKELKSMFGYEK